MIISAGKIIIFSMMLFGFINAAKAQPLCQRDRSIPGAYRSSDGSKFNSKAGVQFNKSQCESYESSYQVNQKCPSGTGTIINGEIKCSDKNPLKEETDRIIEKVVKYCRAQGFSEQDCDLYKKNKAKAHLFYSKNTCLFDAKNPECDGPPSGYNDEPKEQVPTTKEKVSDPDLDEPSGGGADAAFKELDESTRD